MRGLRSCRPLPRVRRDWELHLVHPLVWSPQRHLHDRVLGALRRRNMLRLRRNRKICTQRLPRMCWDRTVPSLPRHWQVRCLSRRRLHPEPKRHRKLQELRWNGDDGCRLARASQPPFADTDLSRVRKGMARGSGNLPELRAHQASMPWLRSHLGYRRHVLQQVRLRKGSGISRTPKLVGDLVASAEGYSTSF